MKKVPNRHYSKEFREEAVKLANERGFVGRRGIKPSWIAGIND
jgi:transposase-like protein